MNEDIRNHPRIKEQRIARGELADLLKIESGVSDSALEYIDSVNVWVGDLTPKQIEVIHNIWDRYCG